MSPRSRCKSFAARNPIFRSPGSRTTCRSSGTPTASTIWKPFAAPAWTRACGSEHQMQFLFSNHVLDTSLRELRRGSEAIDVEPQVLDLLIYLMENRDRVVSKDDLIASVWNDRIVSDATLTSRIYAARKAVGDSGREQKLIRTIARKGLRFVGAVRALS